MRLTGLVLTFAAVTLVGGCVMVRAPDARPSPPIPPSFNVKKAIADAMKGFFVEPSSLRSVMITDPLPIDVPSSTANWLVCVEADARAEGGGYMGPRRFAFGIQVSEPTIEQKNVERINPAMKASASATFVGGEIDRIECDRHPLQWRPWPDWARSSDPLAAKQHGHRKST